MSRHQLAESLQSPVVERPRSFDTSNRPPQVGRWLTCKSAAEYLDFTSARAFRQWAARNAIPNAHRGRVLIFWSGDLDIAVGAGRV